MPTQQELVREVSFPRRLKHAVARQKANPLRLLKDVAQLARHPNRLQAAEYFLYRPWDGRLEDSSQTFLGSQGNDRINAGWIGSWADLTRDRLTVDTLLKGFELPIPETQAAYANRTFLDATQLGSRDDVLRFLREQARYPLLCKPAMRNSPRKAVAILGYSKKSDELQFRDERAVGAESFAARWVDENGLEDEDAAFVFQSLLRPHPEIADLSCGHVGSLRINILSDQQGVEMLRASWRIPSGSNSSTSLLDEEVLLAGIDAEKGAITQVVSLDDLEYQLVTTHPESKVAFEDRKLPAWDGVRETVLRAAHAVSDCIVQGWDVAITEEGPVILGLQAGGGDPMWSQLGFSRGLLEGRYAEFARRALASQKKKRKHHWQEMKGNMAQQMSNLQFHQGDAGTEEGEAPTRDISEGNSQEQEFQIDTEAKTDFSFSQRMLNAVTQHNANLVTIISDVAKLSRNPNRLPPYEYFLYQLWDETRFDLPAKQTFVGSDGWVRINMAMRNMWRELAEDKLALAAVLRANGLPIPETQAIYHEGRHFPGAEQLVTPSDVSTFLRERAVYPLFGKPVGGQQSCGAVGMEAYDAASDTLQLADGSSVKVDAFVQQITVDEDSAAAYGSVQLSAGYLFQTQLRTHPQLANIVGQRTGTVRMVCVSDDRGVELVRASWKIPACNNVADNLWRAGNMLGGIDLESGKILHVVKPGPLECETVTQHPDSGVPFADFCFPEWEAMRSIVERASSLIHNCTFQGWDVALCEDGPVLVELQAGGGNPVLAQLGYDRGLLQGRYLEHVQRALGKSPRRE